jgi:hypothetical protein
MGLTSEESADRGIEETSASFEALSATRSYPTICDIRFEIL